MVAFYILPVVFVSLCLLNFISYSILKNRIVQRQKWDLNICCGKTDGGGINADIVKHKVLPNFVIVDVYKLPFKDRCFNTVLCSHTIEHVKDPRQFFKELERAGNDVTLVIPPLWDVSAVLNVFEHKWIFLSFKKEHHTLPRYIRLPFSSVVQKYLGERIHA